MAAVGEQTYLTDLTTSPGRIGCQVTQGTAQSGWTTATFTTLTFGTEVFDWGDLFDTGTSTSKILIGKYLGLWQLSGLYVPATSSVATRQSVRATMNGSSLSGAFASVGGTANSQFYGIPLPTVSVISTLSTDNVEIQGWMTAGSGTIGSAVSGEARSMFQALFIGTQS